MEKKRISDERLAELIRAAALRREVPVGLETRGCRRGGDGRGVRLPAVGRFAGGGVAGLGDSGGSRCGDDGRLRRPGDGNSAQAVTFCD